MLLTACGVGTNAIMRRTAKSKTCVWRWQERFIEEGFDGLLATRRVLAHQAAGAETAERVVALTLGNRRGNDRLDRVLMAKAAGLSVSSVQRIWLRPWSATAPDAPVQAVQRPALRRQITRRRRNSMLIRPHTPSCCRSTKKRQIQALDRPARPDRQLARHRLCQVGRLQIERGTLRAFDSAATNVARALISAPPAAGTSRRLRAPQA